jgi:hypothetical protein
MFDDKTRSTVGVKNFQITTFSFKDIFVEIIILSQDVYFSLNIVHNDNRRYLII